jgi:hypothetical protein
MQHRIGILVLLWQFCSVIGNYRTIQKNYEWQHPITYENTQASTYSEDSAAKLSFIMLWAAFCLYFYFAQTRVDDERIRSSMSLFNIVTFPNDICIGSQDIEGK